MPVSDGRSPIIGYRAIILGGLTSAFRDISGRHVHCCGIFPKNMLNFARKHLLGYGIAMLSVALAAVLTTEVSQLAAQAVFLPFFAAILITAWFGGVYQGYFAILLSLTVIALEYIPPFRSFADEKSAGIVLGFYVSISLAFVLLVSALRTRQAAFSAGEIRYRQLFNRFPYPVWIVDLETLKFLEVNEAAVKNYGYSREEFLSMTVKDIRPAKYIPALIEILSDKSQELRSDGVWKHRKKDGTLIDVEVASHRIDFLGRACTLAVAVDVTERERAAAEVRESEARFRLLADGAPVLIWVSGMGKKADWFNQQWLDFTGRTIEQEDHDGWYESVYPEDIDNCRRIYAEAFDQRTSFTMEYRLRRADGEWRSMLDTGIPRFDADSVFEGYIGSCIDITDLKLAEQARIYTEKRYRTLFDCSPEGILLADPKGRYLDANDRICEMLGYGYGEIVGYDAAKFVVADELAHIDEALVETGLRSTQKREWQFRRKDGTVFPGFVTVNTMPDGNLIAVIRDITDRKLAEEERLENEQRMSLATTATGVGIWIWNLATGMIRWDAQMFRIFGIEPTEDGLIEYSRFRELILPEDLADQEQRLKDTIVRGGTTRVEFRFRRPDEDEIRHVEAVETVHKNSDGQAEWIIGTNLDVTERKRSEQIQSESDQRLRLATEATGVGVWEWNVATRKIHCDAQIFRLYGLKPTPDGLVDYRVWKKLVVPEDYKQQENLFREIAQRKGKGRRVFRIRRPDEESCRYIESFEIVHVNDAGVIEKMVGTNIDVTEREIAAEARDKLASIVESSDDAIISKDLHGTVMTWNAGAERMFGYSADEMIGKPIALTIPPDRSHEEAEIIARIVSGEMMYHFETVRLAKDGSPIDVSETISPLFDKDGRIVGASKIARDITGSKRAAERINQLNAELEQRVMERTAELEAANRELESFSYSVSHDLRAPLRHLDGFSSALLEDYADSLDEGGRVYLREVRNASQEMAQLVDDVLKLSRISRTEMLREKFDLSALVSDIVFDLRRLDPDRCVEVAIETGLTAYGDERLLSIALKNLLGNAWKFTGMEPDPVIEFGFERSNGTSAYFVRDNGVGFDMAYADNLFRPFQRLHSTHDFEGSGIGLATVQRVINRHGGKVWAESKVSDGAIFRFSLPDIRESQHDS
jgi:PAS domain S-box-containing protein